MLGPIDYIVVGFDGNNFDGSVLGELQKATDSGIIRIVDLLFVIKDEAGNVAAAELTDQSDDIKALATSLNIEKDMQLLTEDDVAKLGETMANNTAAGVLVVEQLWAKGLKKALIDAHGVLIAEGRVHPEAVAAAVEELETLPAA